MDLYGYSEKQFEELLKSIVTEEFVIEALQEAGLLPNVSFKLNVTYSGKSVLKNEIKQHFVDYGTKIVELGKGSTNDYKDMAIRSHKNKNEVKNENYTFNLAS